MKDPHPQDGVQLELLFKFKVQDLPRTLELILEGADLFEVFLNEEKAEKPPRLVPGQIHGQNPAASLQDRREPTPSAVQVLSVDGSRGLFLGWGFWR